MQNLENCDCLCPQSLNEVTDLLAEKDVNSILIAGGTDLMAQWKAGHLAYPERVISLLGVADLKAISETEKSVEIGAAVTHSELMSSTVIQKHLSLLSQAAGTVGAVQIQMRGTIGGSVANASPAGDLVPSMLVYDGVVNLISKSGERQVALTDFFKGYKEIDLQAGELIKSFTLSKSKTGEKAVFRKLGLRKAQAISKVMCAIRFLKDGSKLSFCALAFGSVGPIPLRLVKFEEWIKGKDLSLVSEKEIWEKISDEISPIDDIRSTGEYRNWVSGRIISDILLT